MKLWTSQGELVATLPYQRLLHSAQFSPDGQFILTVSSTTAKLWTSKGALVAILSHQDGVNSAQFSPNGQFIVTASTNGTAKLWNVGNLNLDDMLSQACQEIRNYLKHNVEEADRSLCDGIPSVEEETGLAR